jgi:aldehyde dehydrogenase (NAD+)
MVEPLYQDILNKQRVFFDTGSTRNLNSRREALCKLKQGIIAHEQELLSALQADMGKSVIESYMSEIAPIIQEINHALRNLKRWAKPRKVRSPLSLFGSAGRIYHEPYGVILIIAPWNYPLSLAIWPLIGAIAAGNCAVIKPSELTPNVSQAFTRLIADIFPPEYIASIEGGAQSSTELLKNKFDYIFFTGSSGVGRIVMQAAAEQLTPVTLELGGKSPCIVDEDANIKLAARRIVWGKLINGGQTCVAPDYLYVHKNVKDQLLQSIRAYVEESYGSDMLRHTNYPRMLNAKQYHRVQQYLQQGQVLYGGRSDESSLRIELTLLDHVRWEDSIMQEEIFGPILPVLAFEHLDDVIETVRRQPKPLACYIFSESPQTQERVVREIPFGGGCVNDTVIHLSSPYLPFGGIGPSGTGSYHGKASFDGFSHHKSVLKQTTMFDFPIRYTSSSTWMKWIKAFVKHLT